MRRSKVKINFNKFITTKEGAYVLGFIWGDGRIANKSRTDLFISANDANEIFSIFYKTTNLWKISHKNIIHGKTPKKYIWLTNLGFTQTLCDFLFKIKSSGIL